jgi:Protein of unknown function (DUF5818)
MHPLKRDFVYMCSVATLVFAFALAWGRPFVSARADSAQTQAQQQQQSAQDGSGQAQANAQTFTGAVVRNGDTYALRDSSGAVYGLDDSSRASQFEGRSVKLTGHLDHQSKVIHVESIESGEV